MVNVKIVVENVALWFWRVPKVWIILSSLSWKSAQRENGTCLGDEKRGKGPRDQVPKVPGILVTPMLNARCLFY